MKKILATTLFAVIALSAATGGALAQSAGNGNGGRGGNNGGGGGGGHSTALDARIILSRPCLAAYCNPPRRRHRVVQKSDGCECTLQSIGVGANISYVKNCYYYDPVADAQRYCAPWERSGS